MICQKFVMPAIKSAHPSLKLSALRAASDIAKVCQKSQSSDTDQVVMVHHNDLVNESIECMKLKTWTLEEKEVALSIALELVRIQPRVSQGIRCALLRACFTSVFPMMMDKSISGSSTQVWSLSSFEVSRQLLTND